MSNPAYPFIYHFCPEKVPLLYTFNWEMVPFHIPIYNFASLFNCCKYTVSKIWINPKTRTFSWLFQCHKIDLLALFMHQNNRFPYPFIYFNLWNLYPFIVSFTWRLRTVPLLSLVLRAVGYFGSFATLCQLAVPDPHLEIRGGLVSNKHFSALWASVWSKNKGWEGGGVGPSPGSATG